MSSTFVTLAEVLEARGGPLLEEEVWSLLLGTAESLVDVSYKGKGLSITLCIAGSHASCPNDTSNAFCPFNVNVL